MWPAAKPVGRMTGSAPADADRERLRSAVHASAAAEFSTASGGRPVTFPLTPFYDDDRDVLVVSSPPAFAGKVENVRDTPAVSLRLYGAEEPLLVRGTAGVRDDDPWAAAEYVRGLVEDEPATRKREAQEAAVSFLDSRLGRFLMDWYGLRVVVEVEPESVEPAGDDGPMAAVPAWEAAGLDRREAASYERVVLGVVGPDGYPAAWPVTGLTVRDGSDDRADPDSARADPGGHGPADPDEGPAGEAVVEAPSAPAVEAGQPACLLCHWHSPDLSDLGQRLVRGRCYPAADGLRFRPASTFALRNETALDALRFVLDGKRRTRAYFGETGPLDWWW